MKPGKRLLGPLVLVAAFLAPALVLAQAGSNEVCLSCHGARGLEKTRKGKPVSLYVAGERFSKSVHGSLPCTACHSDIAQLPHAPELKPAQCATCHADAFQAYSQSVHGRAQSRGEGDAASCGSCHGSHDILPVKNPDSSVYPLNLPRTCGACHGDPELAKRHKIPVVNAYQLYMDSIHGRALSKSGLLVAANCTSCHGSHGILPAGDPKSTVNRANVPRTCGQCHEGVLKVFLGSIHGKEAAKGNPAAPVCINCHSSHEIRRVERESWKLDIVRECGTCHAQFLRTYRDTFHGQVSALGFTRVARCSDCHGAHDILPVSDPGSSVGRGRIVETCRKCHPSANGQFARYDPHADPHNRSRNPVLYYSARFMIWLLVGVFVFFGLHTVLWASSPVIRRRGRPRRPDKERKDE